MSKPPTIDLIAVPAGPFEMGHNGDSRAAPAHQVDLPAYEIGRTPVTNAEYLPFMQDTGHAAPSTWEGDHFPAGEETYPVAGVNWESAWLYCAWLRHRTGQPFHLPTEAQWEKAARWDVANGRSRPYPWGDTPDPARCNSLNSGPNRTTPVGSYAPAGDSAYGVSGLIGNVEEWCLSIMEAEYPYTQEDGRDEPNAPGRRAIRGGDWWSVLDPAWARHAPSERWLHLWGLRVACSDAVERSHKARIDNLSQIISENEALLRGEIERIKRPNELADLYYNWGATLLQISRLGVDQFAAADQAFSKALDYHRAATTGQAEFDHPEGWVWYNRGLVRLEQSRLAEAYADVNQAILIDKDDPDGYRLRAGIAVRQGNTVQATHDIQWLIAYARRQGQQSDAQLEAATFAAVQEAIENWQAAAALYTEILTAPERNDLWATRPRPEIYLRRAQVHDHLGNAEAARSDYYHYLLWCPDVPEAATLWQRVNTVTDL